MSDSFHACAFVQGRDEERQFLAEGVRNGEKALYIVDDALRAEHERTMEDAGVRGRPGQVVYTTWLETYLADGRFSAAKMLGAVEEVMRAAAGEGYPRMRVIGQMGWAFTGAAGIEELVGYEAAVNEVLARTKNPAVCVYDVRRLDGAMMMDLLRTHPLTVVGGVLYANPLFTPPEQMLAEIRARRDALAS